LTAAAAYSPRGAHSNAKPPPMQNPITPVLPVQSSRSASHPRHASKTSNAGPDPARNCLNMPRMQRSQDFPPFRSGARDR
jgi:hypothetical protein